MAKTVTFEIDTDLCELTVDSGTLFLGEQAPIVFAGYTPASGNTLFLSLFDKDHVTPLADNATSANTLDLRYEALRDAFGDCKAAHSFYATVIERTSGGSWVGQVLAAGHVRVEWSPVVFDAVSGNPATLKGATGATGAALTWDMLTDAQKASLKGADGANGATGATGPQGPQGIQGIPGIQGIQGEKGKDGVAGSLTQVSDLSGRWHDVRLIPNELGELTIAVDQSESELQNDSIVDTQNHQTINGTKTFTTSPIVPTVSDSDDSAKAATTSWVRARIAAWWNAIKGAAVTFGSTVTATGGFIGNLTGHASQDALDSSVVHLTGNDTIGGTKTFTSNIISLRSGNNIAYISRFAGTSRDTPPANTKTVEYRLEDASERAVNDIVQHWNKDNGLRVIHLRSYKANGSYVDIATFKANADGSSVSAEGSALAAVGMPSNSIIENIMPLENGATYIAPLNGYISIIQYSNVEGNSYLRLTGSASIGCADRATIAGTMMHVFIPIAKGATATLYCSNVKTGTYSMMRFIEAQAEV